MQIITKYKANDGREFTDDKKCVIHELNCECAERIMSELPSTPNSCEFKNGSGYVQHDSQELLNTRNAFLGFVMRYSDHKWIRESIEKGFDADPSWAGKIISECAPNIIYKHWARFMCIDKKFREWGQPYYSAHPDEAKQNKLN